MSLAKFCEVAPHQSGFDIAHCGLRRFFRPVDETVWPAFSAEQSPLLKIGLGLGAESPDPNTHLPMRLVRKDEAATIAIAVTSSETRVVTHAVDKRKSWPGVVASQWQCGAVRVGDDGRKLSSGSDCNGCNVKLRYMTGRDPRDLDALLDSLSNVRAFNFRRLSGSFLVLLGAFLDLAPSRAFSRRRRPLDSPVQGQPGASVDR